MKIRASFAWAAAVASLASGLAIQSAFASPYPLTPVQLGGSLDWTTNTALNTTQGLKSHSFDNATLIRLLNRSSNASNVVFQVTGRTNIPANSLILWDPGSGELIVSNSAKNFSFPLSGYYADSGGQTYYSFAYLQADAPGLIGVSNLTAKRGSESDETGIYFYFNNQNDDQSVVIALSSDAQLAWSYGPTKNGNLTATLSVSAYGCANDDCLVHDYIAVPGTFFLNGFGSGAEAASAVPFYLFSHGVD